MEASRIASTGKNWKQHCIPEAIAKKGVILRGLKVAGVVIPITSPSNLLFTLQKTDRPGE